MSLRQPQLCLPGQGTLIPGLGGIVRYPVLGAHTDDRYRLGVRTLAPGESVANSGRSDAGEGYFVRSGEVTFTIGDQTSLIPSGGFIHLPSGTDHTMINSGSVPAEMVIIQAATSEPSLQSKPQITPPGQGLVVSVVGDVYRYLVTGDDTDGKYALIDAIVTPGGGPPPHIHSREDEAFFVLEGRVHFYVDDRDMIGEPGACVQLPPSRPHRFHNDTDTPARMLILLAPAGLERMFVETGTRLDSAESPATPVGPDDIQRLLAVAPQYGVEILH